MNESTIGPRDGASLSMGTLMVDMEGGGDNSPGTVRERCRKFWRRASLASAARWGTCGVVDVGGGLGGLTSPHGCPLTGNSERLS